MQYQWALFLVNITLLALILLVFRFNAPKLRFLVFSTIYAYILAALLPFLLLWLSLEMTVMFYILAIGFVFAIALYRKSNPKKGLKQAKKAAETVISANIKPDEATISIENEEAVNKLTAEPVTIADDNAGSKSAEIQINEIIPAVEPAIAEEAETPVTETADCAFSEAESAEVDLVEYDLTKLDLTETEGTETEDTETEISDQLIPAKPEDIPTEIQAGAYTEKQYDEQVQDIPAATELQLPPERDSSEDESIDIIEQLIIKAFDAKFNDNYSEALTIFERILEYDPPEEIVNLILDDVEVLFVKLVS